MMSERDLLIDCLKRLNQSGLDYMLTGSMASNYWGIPRTTHDLDFVLRFQPTDAPALIEQFRDDFFLQPDSVQAAFEPPYQFNALDERSALKVDFWVLGDDPFEQQAFDRRCHVTVFETCQPPNNYRTSDPVVLHKRLG